MKHMKYCLVVIMAVLAFLLPACTGGGGNNGETAYTKPEVVTSNATGITTSLATLNGDLTNLGTASGVDVSFQWGTSTGSYPNETTTQRRTATGSFSFNLTGLNLGTTYYFRAKAVGDGTSYSSENNFTTSNAAASPPITIALDYYGIRNTHPAGGSLAQIQLVVKIWDEEHNLATFTIPPEEIGGSDMDYFQVNAVKDHMDPEVFAGTATGSLTAYVAAYNVNSGLITKEELDALGLFFGFDMSYLKSLVPDKDYLGSYWRTWSPLDNWGIGGNYTFDDGNLIVWLRIGSGQMPDAVPQPVLNPDVKIADLTLPPNPRVGGWYPTTFTLVNNESFQILVTWEAISSVTGRYDSGDVTVPAKSSLPVPLSYYYGIAGSADITYNIYWNWGDHRKLDTKSGTITVSP